MLVEMKLPQFGMGMSSGILTKWLKQVGDRVMEDEVILEVEAEKSVVEVGSPASGIVEQILFPEGASVPVYEVIAILRQDD